MKYSRARDALLACAVTFFVSLSNSYAISTCELSILGWTSALELSIELDHLRGENITYFNTEQQNDNLITVEKGLLMYKGRPLDTRKSITSRNEGFQIIALSKDGRMITTPIAELGIVQHSTLVNGEKGLFFGEIKVTNGIIEVISDQSGHYRPHIGNVKYFLDFLESQGYDTKSVKLQLVYSRKAVMEGTLLSRFESNPLLVTYLSHVALDSHRGVKEQALLSLNLASHIPPEAKENLRSVAMKDSHEYYRVLAAELLSRSGDGRDVAQELFTKGVQSPSKQVRILSAIGLHRLGFSSDVVINELFGLDLKDPDITAVTKSMVILAILEYGNRAGFDHELIWEKVETLFTDFNVSEYLARPIHEQLVRTLLDNHVVLKLVYEKFKDFSVLAKSQVLQDLAAKVPSGELSALLEGFVSQERSEQLLVMLIKSLPVNSQVLQSERLIAAGYSSEELHKLAAQRQMMYVPPVNKPKPSPPRRQIIPEDN